MGFLTALSDDQLALLGCATAFFLFGGLMSLSYYVGRAGRSSTQSAPRAKRMVRNEAAASNRADEVAPRRDDRRAA